MSTCLARERDFLSDPCHAMHPVHALYDSSTQFHDPMIQSNDMRKWLSSALHKDCRRSQLCKCRRRSSEKISRSLQRSVRQRQQRHLTVLTSTLPGNLKDDIFIWLRSIVHSSHWIQAPECAHAVDRNPFGESTNLPPNLRTLAPAGGSLRVGPMNESRSGPFDLNTTQRRLHAQATEHSPRPSVEDETLEDPNDLYKEGRATIKVRTSNGGSEQSADILLLGYFA